MRFCTPIICTSTVIINFKYIVQRKENRCQVLIKKHRRTSRLCCCTIRIKILISQALLTFSIIITDNLSDTYSSLIYVRFKFYYFLCILFSNETRSYFHINKYEINEKLIRLIQKVFLVWDIKMIGSLRKKERADNFVTNKIQKAPKLN